MQILAEQHMEPAPKTYTGEAKFQFKKALKKKCRQKRILSIRV